MELSNNWPVKFNYSSKVFPWAESHAAKKIEFISTEHKEVWERGGPSKREKELIYF